MAKKQMPKIKIGRYEQGSGSKYLGWIEPEDRRWILFVLEDGTPQFFSHRDPQTGACIDVSPG